MGVLAEKVVAEAGLSPGIVEEEHPSVDTDELLRIYATLEAIIGVDAVVTVSTHHPRHTGSLQSRGR